MTFLRIEHWYLNIDTGELSNSLLPEIDDNENERVDPLGIKLLTLLANNQGKLVTKDILLEKLWPNTVVNEDALSKCISRVRKILGDQPRQSKFIETLPKRGYRLIASHVEWVESIESQAHCADNPAINSVPKKVIFLVGVSLLVSLVVTIGFALHEVISSPAKLEANKLVQQADVYYHKVTRLDNEAAMELYQKAIALSPNLGAAYSGLANALVQRSIRLSNERHDIAWQDMSLGQALSDGNLFSETKNRQLNKALKLSEKAVKLLPNNEKTHKSLGFVLSALNNFDAAIRSYEKALSINPNAWDVIINMGDIYEISGQLPTAISYYKKAFYVIDKHEGIEAYLSKQWQASLGVTIGNKYFQLNNLIDAEIWFRHVLSFTPFSPEATLGLAKLLKSTGQTNESIRLCSRYTERIGINICD